MTERILNFGRIYSACRIKYQINILDPKRAAARSICTFLE